MSLCALLSLIIKGTAPNYSVLTQVTPSLPESPRVDPSHHFINDVEKYQHGDFRDTSGGLGLWATPCHARNSPTKGHHPILRLLMREFSSLIFVCLLVQNFKNCVSRVLTNKSWILYKCWI